MNSLLQGTPKTCATTVRTRLWFGPPLNSPTHSLLHGAVPVLRNGIHIGWILRTGVMFGGLTV